MKVLVVDDEQPARERLKQLLEDEADFDFVGEAANGGEALELSAELHPDIVLLDYKMPGHARRALADWLTWASRSKLKPFVKAARILRKHFDDIVASF